MLHVVDVVDDAFAGELKRNVKGRLWRSKKMMNSLVYFTFYGRESIVNWEFNLREERERWGKIWF